MMRFILSISNGEATWASCSRQKVSQNGLDEGTGLVATSPPGLSTCSRDLCSQPGSVSPSLNNRAKTNESNNMQLQRKILESTDKPHSRLET